MASTTNLTNLAPSMLPPAAILETFIPGYGFLTHLVSFYFKVDISFYLGVVASLAFWTYTITAILHQFEGFLLHFAASVEIRFHDELYGNAIHWISNQPSLNQTQQFVASTKVNLFAPWDAEDDKERDLSKEDQLQFENDPQEFWTKLRLLNKLRIICCSPAPTRFHCFSYNGCWIVLYCYPYKDTGSLWVASLESLVFFAAPWRKSTLKDLLGHIQKAAVAHDNRIVIKQNLRLRSNFEWTLVASKKLRLLSTVVIDPKLKERIIKDVREFLHPRTQHWYESRGIPYRRGYLFYGPPGTGKSSLCLCIASLMQLDIFMLSLSANNLDESELALLFRDLPKRCIVLIEDVDGTGIWKRSTDNPFQQNLKQTTEDREGDHLETHHREQQSNGTTLSAVLNALDSVGAQEGRILIMTTNHIEELDPALLRPGRVDEVVQFSRADQFALREHFLIFYLKPTNALVMGDPELTGSIHPSSTPACPKWTSDDIANLSVTFANKVSPDQFSAATIENYLLQYKDDPWSAVDNVTEWICEQERHLDVDSKVGPSASHIGKII